MATLRETQGWRITPWLLACATILSCIAVLSKILGKGFAGGLSWWMVAGLVIGTYLVVFGALELFTNYRGPVMIAQRVFQAPGREAPGLCPKCGSRREWLLPLDSRFFPRDAHPSCAVCEEHEFRELEQKSRCATCGGLVSANKYCPICSRRVADESQS